MTKLNNLNQQSKVERIRLEESRKVTLRYWKESEADQPIKRTLHSKFSSCPLRARTMLDLDLFLLLAKPLAKRPD